MSTICHRATGYIHCIVHEMPKSAVGWILPVAAPVLTREAGQVIYTASKVGPPRPPMTCACL